eukprot:705745-Pyramimonas_sp.AAC.1
MEDPFSVYIPDYVLCNGKATCHQRSIETASEESSRRESKSPSSSGSENPSHDRGEHCSIGALNKFNWLLSTENHVSFGPLSAESMCSSKSGLAARLDSLLDKSDGVAAAESVKLKHALSKCRAGLSRIQKIRQRRPAAANNRMGFRV